MNIISLIMNRNPCFSTLHWGLGRSKEVARNSRGCFRLFWTCRFAKALWFRQSYKKLFVLTHKSLEIQAEGTLINFLGVQPLQAGYLMCRTSQPWYWWTEAKGFLIFASLASHSVSTISEDGESRVHAIYMEFETRHMQLSPFTKRGQKSTLSESD